MIDNYQLLKNAIVSQAANDYMRALVNQHNVQRAKETDTTKIELEMIESYIISLEKFFTEPRFAGYTKLDGRTLLADMRQHVIDCDYDLSKIFKKSYDWFDKEEGLFLFVFGCFYSGFWPYFGWSCPLLCGLLTVCFVKNSEKMAICPLFAHFWPIKVGRKTG